MSCSVARGDDGWRSGRIVAMRWNVVAACLLVTSVSPAQNPGVLGAVLGSDGRDVVVRRVVDRSPARKAGLRVGDRLMMIGGGLVRNPQDARTRLYWQKPGAKIRLVVARGEKRHALEAEMTDWKTASALVKWRGKALEAGGEAPAWWAECWDLPDGVRVPPTARSTRGKVVCLFVYQAL